MIVDCHAHLVPRALADRLAARAVSLPGLAVETAGGRTALSFAGSPPTRPISPGLSDTESRLAWLAEQGIDRQIVGPWLDMTGYQLPTDQGAEWSRLINAAFKEFASDYPAFVPLATVPLQSGVAAAEILTEAIEAGFSGAMIGTQPKGRGGVLDDPDLDPFWQAASDLGAVLVLHPMYDCGDQRAGDYGLANALGRITDTAFCLARLLYAGHAEKYSGTEIVVPIGGAALPFVLGRLRRNYALHKDRLADPEAGLKHLWFDTVVHDAATLAFLADKVGWHRIMMGSDMPFPIGDPEPLGVVHALALDEKTLDAVSGGTARRLFKIDT
jgi:aminocarboxymuconate-semialdehyde decarboxylase